MLGLNPSYNVTWLLNMNTLSPDGVNILGEKTIASYVKCGDIFIRDIATCIR